VATIADIDDRIAALTDRVSRVETAIATVGQTVAHNREASDARHGEVMSSLATSRTTMQATTDRLFGMIESRETADRKAAEEIRGVIAKGIAAIVTALLAGGGLLSQCPQVRFESPEVVQISVPIPAPLSPSPGPVPLAPAEPSP